MTFSKPNFSAATLTTTRVTPAPVSGICVTCVDGCEGPCEIGRSALKAPSSRCLLVACFSSIMLQKHSRCQGNALQACYPVLQGP